jgi:pimeloyl-ACP methyl ester carboxylesterase
VLLLILLVFIVPYLISLDPDNTQPPHHDLVSQYGRFLDIDGMAIYVEERNAGSSQQAIVFLHGFGGSTFSWRENAPCFAAQGYRVVSLDLKGVRALP